MQVKFYEDNMIVQPNIIGKDLVCFSPYWEEMVYVTPMQHGEQIGKFIDR